MATRNEGGFGWAEPEMVYQEAETVAAPAPSALWTPDAKEAARPLSDLAAVARQVKAAAGLPPGNNSVKLATAGGARLDMVMSRQLRAAIQDGLALAWHRVRKPLFRS